MHKSERGIYLFGLYNLRKFDKGKVLYLAIFEVMRIVDGQCLSKRI